MSNLNKLKTAIKGLTSSTPVEKQEEEAKSQAYAGISSNTPVCVPIHTRSFSGTPSTYTTWGPTTGAADPMNIGPGQLTWSGQDKTSDPSEDEWHCPLPKNVMEKMLLLGMSNSKKILKKNLREAYDHWVETQKIKVNTLPMLLLASVMALGIDQEMKEESEKK